MSKTKKYKVKLNYQEITFANLKSFSLRKGVNEEDRNKAVSLIKWFQINGYFTAAQISLAKKLTYVKKPAKTAKPKKHYIYAISNGKQVKLGMSNNPETRLKSLQTSSPEALILVWKYYVANSSIEAAKIEKMLHRACKKHHIRGEWFDIACMDIVNSFNPNKKHTAKWEFGKLVTIDKKRTKGILNFEVSNIRRTNLTGTMSRVWAQKETKELYQVEIAKLLDDGHVVLTTIV